MARLVVVSNRVGVPTRSGARAGGLEVAIRAVFKNNPGVWFGWSGRVVPKNEVGTKTINQDGNSFIVTDLTEDDYEEYYSGFANRVLWPILHYRMDLAEYSRRDLTGYLRVNEHFAEELHRVLQPDDLVWVHDYHLLPLAKALRLRGHQNRLGLFLHTPLPPPEILTALPNHDRLLPDICQYDLVGFQTGLDAANFARYLESECGLTARDHLTYQVDGRSVSVGTFPVGVETTEINELAKRAMRSSFVRRFIESLSGRLMIIGVDRLDYTKGIPERLQAYERFLANYSEWRDKVTYVQITPKSRTKIQEYSDMDRLVGATVGRINGTYGEVSWTPIRYVNKTHSQFNLAGLYRSARVALVTPLRDGMNLVAKEYIAAQDPEDPGVLVLSRFAGAASECNAALLVNPYDPESVGAAIARALSMPIEERRQRHQKMFQTLSRNDLTHWGERFLAALRGRGPAIIRSRQQTATALSN